MAKFFGRIGYGFSQETEPGSGVWEDVVIERSYFGDVVKNMRSLEEAQQVNKDIAVNTSISIVADSYANEHFFAIRYVEWAGALWDVQYVDVQSPRLILKLGGVYVGPTA